MRRHAWALAALLAFPAVARPQEKAEATKGTIEERYQALLGEYQSKQEAFQKAYQAAKTDDEKRKAIDELLPKPDTYLSRFLALAEEDPKSKVAFDALMWVATNGRGRRETSSHKALDILTRDYITDPRLAKVLPSLAHSLSPAGPKLLRTALERSPHREVKGLACLALAQHDRHLAHGFLPVAETPEKETQYKQARDNIFGPEYAREIEAKGADAYNEEALTLFERAKAEFADVKTPRGTVGEEAELAMVEVKTLAIGKPAPEIVGKDLDGKEMKLSGYRGKVVVLDFWGDW
jgi:hypothetical protein